MRAAAGLRNSVCICGSSIEIMASLYSSKIESSCREIFFFQAPLSFPTIVFSPALPVFRNNQYVISKKNRVIEIFPGRLNVVNKKIMVDVSKREIMGGINS